MLSMVYCDVHAHVHDAQFDADRADVVKRARDAGLVAMVTVGTNRHTSQCAVDVAHAYHDVWATVGMHPLHAAATAQAAPGERVVEVFDAAFYTALAHDAKVVAIGEVGLDYHHFGDTDDVAAIKEKQKEVFRGCIDVCNAVGKPIVVHCWDAYDDVLEILQQKPVTQRGVIHSFVGGWKTAQKFVDEGYMIGLNGIVTYGDSYDKLIRTVPLEMLLIETDCPYLPPRPLPRDSRCEPKDVVLVACKIADVRGISVEDVAHATMKNAKKVFGW